jgi:hypothetical protein
MTGHKRYKVMSNELEPKPTPSQTVIYQIRIKGHLVREWTDWFEGLTITLEDDGDTLLTGPVVDQAALHGLLKKVRDLGLPLVSINQVQLNETHPYHSKKEKEMNTNRKTAIIVGVLYIVGTVAGILCKVLTTPILDGPDYLVKVSANENQIVLAALFLLIMGLALAMVPVMMFPILKKQNETLALGYVVFRGALETVTTIAMVISWLFLTILSQEYIAGSPDASYFQTLGALLLNGNDSIGSISQIVFPLGALMFYCLLYQSKLIPRWISGWGLIAAVLWIAVTFLDLFGLINPWSNTGLLMALPIFLQEMVMAVWLIVKGFNPSAIASLSAKVEMS